MSLRDEGRPYAGSGPPRLWRVPSSRQGESTGEPRPRGRPANPAARAARRAAIVRAAYVVLTERGYDRTAMSDIARQVNVNQATLYRHYASKRELLDDVFDYAAAKTARALRIGSLPRLDLANSDQLVKLITEFGNRLFALFDDDPAIIRVMTVESSAIDPELRFRVSGLFWATDAALTRLFDDALVDGDAAADRETPAMLARMVLGLAGPGLYLSIVGDTAAQSRSILLSSVAAIADSGLLVEAPESDGEACSATDLPAAPSPTTPMSDRAAQLYAAATELFIERGYRDVDVADIVARCGVGHGTFYNYFRNKRDVLEEMLTRTTAELSAAVSGRRDPAALASRAEYIVEFASRVGTSVAYVADNREAMSFALLTAPGVDEQAYASAVAGYEQLSAEVAAFLAAGITRGWIRDDVDPLAAGRAVVACVVTATLPVLLGDGADFDVAAVAQSCSSFLMGGLHGLLPDP